MNGNSFVDTFITNQIPIMSAFDPHSQKQLDYAHKLSIIGYVLCTIVVISQRTLYNEMQELEENPGYVMWLCYILLNTLQLALQLFILHMNKISYFKLLKLLMQI